MQTPLLARRRSSFMKNIKLSGRELAALRALNFGSGSLGSDIQERTRIIAEEMVEVMNGLMEAGFVEANPPVESVTLETLPKTLFEVNPGYVQELKLAIRRT